MIVTCPSCSARYKINESKIPGRGAKITCQKCGHRFVFYRDGSEENKPAADPVASLDFRTVGLQWRVKANQVALEFSSLGQLQAWLAEGKVSATDPISFNSRKWTPLNEIKDISAYFADVHRKASRGQISLYDESFGESDDDDPEDDSDAPTTIVGGGSQLASEIQDLVRDLATPAPAAKRSRSRFDLVTQPEPDSDPDEAQHEEALADGESPTPLYAVRGGSSSPKPAPVLAPPVRSPAPVTPAPLPPPPSAGPVAKAPVPAATPVAPVTGAAAPQPGTPMAVWVVGGLVVAALIGAGLWFGGVFAP